MDVETVVAPDVSTKFTLLRLGRADYALGEASEVEQLLESAGQETGQTGRFFSVPTPFATAGAGLVVNITRPGMNDLFKTLQAAMDEIRDEEGFKGTGKK
ncbi:MAG: hypothetical protein R3E95_07625 [Thiolinea sp.]